MSRKIYNVESVPLDFSKPDSGVISREGSLASVNQLKERIRHAEYVLSESGYSSEGPEFFSCLQTLDVASASYFAWHTIFHGTNATNRLEKGEGTADGLALEVIRAVASSENLISVLRFEPPLKKFVFPYLANPGGRYNQTDRKDRTRERHAEWQTAANEIWRRHPELSKARVSEYLANRYNSDGHNSEFDHTVRPDTISRIIKKP